MNPDQLAAELLELAETNRPSMGSWVSGRLREIADRLMTPPTNGKSRKKGTK